MVERFISPAPPPTPYQRELAEIMAEECAEITQRAMKLTRFGLEDIQGGPGSGYDNNVDRLSDEVGDLLEVLDWANGAGIIDLKRAIAHKPIKRAKLQRYLQNLPTEAELIAVRIHVAEQTTPGWFRRLKNRLKPLSNEQLP